MIQLGEDSRAIRILKSIRDYGLQVEPTARYPYDALFDINGKTVAVEIKLREVDREDIKIFQQMLAVAPADLFVVVARGFDKDTSRLANDKRILLVREDDIDSLDYLIDEYDSQQQISSIIGNMSTNDLKEYLKTKGLDNIGSRRQLRKRLGDSDVSVWRLQDFLRDGRGTIHYLYFSHPKLLVEHLNSRKYPILNFDVEKEVGKIPRIRIHSPAGSNSIIKALRKIKSGGYKERSYPIISLSDIDHCFHTLKIRGIRVYGHLPIPERFTISFDFPYSLEEVPKEMQSFLMRYCTLDRLILKFEGFTVSVTFSPNIIISCPNYYTKNSAFSAFLKCIESMIIGGM